MSFSAADRALLAQLADELIPAHQGHLSASAAGVAGEGLDQLLTSRPDLEPALEQVLRLARGRNAAEAMTDLRADHPAEFAILAEIVPSAYFMNPRVREAVGYSGQTARPIDPHPDYLDDGLLDSVISRGPIYRPTPTTPNEG
jgi:hypothetical protein